ncbi:unknown [Cryptophlebia leucotreta granulovirus]|uniref:Uncharacterized protein n=1 Tax=Cryptophlebia leucotreta granulosis virus TaxID=35254 RepID=Q7T5H6_GVCL|nr:hypothetical protein [Cryptophlebia leucotreta granulovirus]AAQ21712.1 unknown [Cryptophlebia leucotreta granulovirus]
MLSNTLNETLIYSFNEYKNDLCIDNSHIGDRLRFRIYIPYSDYKYYLYISETSLSTVRNKESATIFRLRYENCLNHVDKFGTFICYFYKKKWPCEDGLLLDKSINAWKQNIIVNLTSVTSIIETSTTIETSTISTTLIPNFNRTEESTEEISWWTFFDNIIFYKNNGDIRKKCTHKF